MFSTEVSKSSATRICSQNQTFMHATGVGGGMLAGKCHFNLFPDSLLKETNVKKITFSVMIQVVTLLTKPVVELSVML